MGMPQIPDGANRPTFDETIIDLLESVALEEMALAHILNAQGEKLQELIKKYKCNCLCYCQLENGFKCSQGMLNSVIMKEWLLITKMNTILELDKEIDTENACEKPKNCGEDNFYR